MTRDALAEGRPPQEVLNEGLVAGMSVVGEDFKHNILYVPEVLIAARAMKAGMAVLKPLLAAKDGGSAGVGVLEGRRTTTSLTDTGRRCLLPIHPKARVYGLPIISGHVGADAAACLLATDLAHEDRLVAIMDIGTNTELIVGNRHRILAASCPAGPAFEGGGISCGMPALDGAVESVSASDAGTFRFGVIGDIAPEGLCGSGLVDPPRRRPVRRQPVAGHAPARSGPRSRNCRCSG
jgi:hypothetical protein